MRDQFAVLHWDVTTEKAFQPKKAASLPVYLFWAVSGVTLADEQMVKEQVEATMPAGLVAQIYLLR